MAQEREDFFPVSVGRNTTTNEPYCSVPAYDPNGTLIGYLVVYKDRVEWYRSNAPSPGWSGNWRQLDGKL